MAFSTSGRHHVQLTRLGGAGSSFRIFASTDSRDSPLNCLAASHHLVEHRAKAEDVGPAVDRAPLGLLGRHVRRRADRRALVGERDRPRGRRVVIWLEQLRDAEVEHFHVAGRRDHDIGRLQIAMDDAGAVSFRQRVGDPRREFQRLSTAGSPFAGMA